MVGAGSEPSRTDRFAYTTMKVLLYLTIVALLVGYRPLRRMFLELDPLRRSLLGGLFILLLAGQIVAKKYPTYPFVKWGMYDDYARHLGYYEYVGVRSDGSRAPFPIAHLVRTHSSARAIECPTCGKRLLWRMRELGHERRRAEGNKGRRATRARYDDTLRAAWNVYKDRNPEADFEKVVVWRATTDVSDYVDDTSIERRRLWHVALTPDGDRAKRAERNER